MRLDINLATIPYEDAREFWLRWGLGVGLLGLLTLVLLGWAVQGWINAGRDRQTIARLQTDGTCWCGSTVWQGKTAMRISVSSWATSKEDVNRSLAAMLQAAAE